MFFDRRKSINRIRSGLLKRNSATQNGYTTAEKDRECESRERARTVLRKDGVTLSHIRCIDPQRCWWSVIHSFLQAEGSRLVLLAFGPSNAVTLVALRSNVGCRCRAVDPFSKRVFS